LWFPDDDSAEWLAMRDAELSLRVLDALGGAPEKLILEIGVWKGGWSSVILMNNRFTRVTGIDPYPDFEDVKLQCGVSFEKLGLSARYELFSEQVEVPAGAMFDLVHIDGLHTEKQVLKDLGFAAQRLQAGGVIIVDDFMSLWFPGITSAVFQFMLSTEFRIFMVSGSKAYIARAESSTGLWDWFLNRKQDFEHTQIYENLSDTDTNSPYVQETDILGQPCLIAGQPKKPGVSLKTGSWGAAVLRGIVGQGFLLDVSRKLRRQ
jgi:hypothetical protein